MSGKRAPRPRSRTRQLSDAELIVPKPPTLTFDERVRRERLLRDARSKAGD